MFLLLLFSKNLLLLDEIGGVIIEMFSESEINILAFLKAKFANVFSGLFTILAYFPVWKAIFT